MGKPKRYNSYDKDVQTERANVEQAGRNRQDKTGIGSSLRAPAPSQPLSSGGINRDDRKLDTQFGGKLFGPMAYEAETDAISSGDLDITINSAGDVRQARGLIFVTPESGNTDTLDTVTGQIFDGQEVILTGVSGNTITITHNSGGAGSILCPGDVNFTLNDDESVTLRDDVTAATQTWRVVAISKTSAGGGDNLGNHTATQDLIMGQNEVNIQEQASDPATPAANTGSLYAKDNGGNAEPYWIDDNGNVTNIIAAGSGDNLGNHTATQDLDMNAFSIILDADADTNINSAIDDAIDFQTTSTTRLQITNTMIDAF
jgi:hypothetical protein